MVPIVKAFFDQATNTVSYIVSDPAAQKCAVIDSLLDYDAASGRTATHAADMLVEYIQHNNLTLEWIIDTHVHADHLTAAPYIRERLGGKTGIGDQITSIQRVFRDIFNEDQSFRTDGSQFDHLFAANETYHVGSIKAKAISTPGHTPACMCHLIGDALFVGDTLFMPDFGTARCDFPGGDAGALYDSAQELFKLPDTTRVFSGHDYKTAQRDYFAWESTILDQRQHNVQIHQNVSRADFIETRTKRDATLSMPKLILPSVQINMRAGDMPPPEEDGQSYLKVPINKL